jgi:ribosomal protein S25
MLEYAIKYMQLGWSVIPLKPKDKRSMVKWKNRQTDRATEDEIRGWWKKYPNANIGIVTGEISGIDVIDFDGSGARAMLEEKLGKKLPKSLRSKTGGGGEHLFLKHNEKARNCVKVLSDGNGNSIDVRANGGIIVLPPSIHPNGNPYEWIEPPNNDLSNLAEWTSNLIEVLMLKGNNRNQDRTEWTGVAKGKRNDTLASRMGHLVKIKGISFEEVFEIAREMNSTYKPPLPDAEVVRIVKSISERERSKGKTVEVHGVSAVELMAKEFPEPCWAIPGILPEGLNMLAGKPKKGKSIMSLNVGIAIAQGGLALGRIPVKKGTVLYLALEDTERRIKNRLELMLSDGGAPPDNLYFSTKWPRMNEGGLEVLQKKIVETPDTRLVIIDTLQKFRAPVNRASNLYAADYEAVTSIKEVADTLSVPILLIHHLRKSDSDDIFDTISGTLGLSGNADGLLILKQEVSRSFTLHITGRDVESTTMAVKLDTETLSWKLLGNRAMVMSTEKKQKVFNAVKDAGRAISALDVVEMTGVDRNYARTTLKRLLDQGLIEKPSKGRYQYLRPVEQASLPCDGGSK